MAQNLKLRTSGGWLNVTPIYGVGFPNGVVSASVGSIYIDKNVSNGASSWIKKSGTGNTGWQVLEGDTGVRNITALSTQTVTYANSQIYIRRVDNIVIVQFIDFRLETTNAAPTFINGSSITGFKPLVTMQQAVTTETVRMLRFRALSTNGNFNFFNFVSGDSVIGTIMYITDAAWPTTLPGTAA